MDLGNLYWIHDLTIESLIHQSLISEYPLESLNIHWKN